MPAVWAYIVENAVAIIINAVVAIAAAILTQPDIPKPERGKSNFRQSIPPRQIAYGRCRISGPNLLYTTVGRFCIDVIALCVGPIDEFEEFYLHDDKVTMLPGFWVDKGEDGRYGENKVQIFTRNGATPQLPILDIITASEGLWNLDCRADGTALMAILARAVVIEQQNRVYPNGELLGSAVGRWSKVYDWRKDGTQPGGFGDQRRDNPESWAWSENPVVCLVHDEWYVRGHDWDYRFAPTLASWTAAADNADEHVPLKDGGYESRYTFGGWYQKTNPPKALRSRFIESFDGMLIERGDGAYICHGGFYYEPTVTLNEDRILAMGWTRSRREEDVVNKLVVAFASPQFGYSMVEADPWYDLVDWNARGYDKAQGFERPWVTSNGQARRLAKRLMARYTSTYRGFIEIDISDDESELEQRYIRLQNRRGPPSMWDVVVEVRGITIDLGRRRARLEIIKADPFIDLWDPDTEEGAPPNVPFGPGPQGTPPPEFVDVQVVLQQSAPGVYSPKLNALILDMDRPDLDYVLSWRDASSPDWTDGTRQTGADVETSPAQILLTSTFVAQVEQMYVRAKSISAGGVSDWVEWPVAVSTLESSAAPPPPTGITVEVLPPVNETVRVRWTNPAPDNFGYATVWRAQASFNPLDPLYFPGFNLATDISGPLPGAPSEAMEFLDLEAADLKPMRWRYWVTATSSGSPPYTSLPGGGEFAEIPL
jgi:hypothetical protein